MPGLEHKLEIFFFSIFHNDYINNHKNQYNINRHKSHSLQSNVENIHLAHCEKKIDFAKQFTILAELIIYDFKLE